MNSTCALTRSNCRVAKLVKSFGKAARQLCGLKFRREHPIGPFIVDFACVPQKLVVEIDGGHHDQTVDRDRSHQELIERAGWEVIRFTDKDVEEDVLSDECSRPE
jgi:very-short-patch-repair endonuclease